MKLLLLGVDSINMLGMFTIDYSKNIYKYIYIILCQKLYSNYSCISYYYLSLSFFSNSIIFSATAPINLFIRSIGPFKWIVPVLLCDFISSKLKLIWFLTKSSLKIGWFWPITKEKLKIYWYFSVSKNVTGVYAWV